MFPRLDRFPLLLLAACSATPAPLPVVPVDVVPPVAAPPTKPPENRFPECLTKRTRFVDENTIWIQSARYGADSRILEQAECWIRNGVLSSLEMETREWSSDGDLLSTRVVATPPREQSTVLTHGEHGEILQQQVSDSLLGATTRTYRWTGTFAEAPPATPRLVPDVIARNYIFQIADDLTNPGPARSMRSFSFSGTVTIDEQTTRYGESQTQPAAHVLLFHDGLAQSVRSGGETTTNTHDSDRRQRESTTDQGRRVSTVWDGDLIKERRFSRPDVPDSIQYYQYGAERIPVEGNSTYGGAPSTESKYDDRCPRDVESECGAASARTDP